MHGGGNTCLWRHAPCVFDLCCLSEGCAAYPCSTVATKTSQGTPAPKQSCSAQRPPAPQCFFLESSPESRRVLFTSPTTTAPRPTGRGRAALAKVRSMNHGGSSAPLEPEGELAAVAGRQKLTPSGTAANKRGSGGDPVTAGSAPQATKGSPLSWKRGSGPRTSADCAMR